MLAARDGRSVADGVGLDPHGEPTTNPEQILEGVQLAFGGYKGVSIALMIEILAAGLSGGEFSFEAAGLYNGDGGPTKAGHLIIALDPQHFNAQFRKRIETLFTLLLSENGVRLPGDRRLLNRTRTSVTGVSLPKALYDAITAISEQA